MLIHRFPRSSISIPAIEALDRPSASVYNRWCPSPSRYSANRLSCPPKRCQPNLAPRHKCCCFSASRSRHCSHETGRFSGRNKRCRRCWYQSTPNCHPEENRMHRVVGYLIAFGQHVVGVAFKFFVSWLYKHKPFSLVPIQRVPSVFSSIM